MKRKLYNVVFRLGGGYDKCNCYVAATKIEDAIAKAEKAAAREARGYSIRRADFVSAAVVEGVYLP